MSTLNKIYTDSLHHCCLATADDPYICPYCGTTDDDETINWDRNTDGETVHDCKCMACKGKYTILILKDDKVQIVPYYETR